MFWDYQILSNIIIFLLDISLSIFLRIFILIFYSSIVLDALFINYIDMLKMLIEVISIDFDTIFTCIIVLIKCLTSN